jgi:hypothetical protein
VSSKAKEANMKKSRGVMLAVVLLFVLASAMVIASEYQYACPPECGVQMYWFCTSITMDGCYVSECWREMPGYPPYYTQGWCN